MKGEVFWRRRRTASRRSGEVVDVGGRSKEKDDEEIKMFSSQAECSSLIFLSLI